MPCPFCRIKEYFKPSSSPMKSSSTTNFLINTNASPSPGHYPPRSSSLPQTPTNISSSPYPPRTTSLPKNNNTKNKNTNNASPPTFPSPKPKSKPPLPKLTFSMSLPALTLFQTKKYPSESKEERQQRKEEEVRMRWAMGKEEERLREEFAEWEARFGKRRWSEFFRVGG